MSHGCSGYRYSDVLALWVETSRNFQSNHKHRYVLCYFERGCQKKCDVSKIAGCIELF